MKITDIKAIEILDSRGNPTVRTFITLDDNSIHSASVPSGASTGTYEALELRDGDNRYGGKSVQKAVENVNADIAKKAIGMDIENPRVIDEVMLELDGTDHKDKLGANAILSVSLAAHRAAAASQKLPLWKFLNEYYFQPTSSEEIHKQPTADNNSPAFPRLMVNVVNGGKHAGWNFDIQEFMIVPNTTNPSSSVRIAAEIFQQLGKNLHKKGLSTLVGDEGGYSPSLQGNDEVFQEIIQAAKDCGYENIKDYRFALDCAANEWLENEMYLFRKNNEEKTADQLIEYYSEIGQKYFIESFEDAFAEDDWAAFKKFSAMAEKFKFQVVGDDLFVTNPKRIRQGIEEKAANAVLVKLNQIGSVTETVSAIQMTQKAGWKVIISHRSGETEDPFIADLAYACAAEFIKAGSMSRSDRLAKYNRLLEIEAGM